MIRELLLVWVPPQESFCSPHHSILGSEKHNAILKLLKCDVSCFYRTVFLFLCANISIQLCFFSTLIQKNLKIINLQKNAKFDIHICMHLCSKENLNIFVQVFFCEIFVTYNKSVKSITKDETVFHSSSSGFSPLNP